MYLVLRHVRSQKLQLSTINRAGYDGVSARAHMHLNICRLKCVHHSLYVLSVPLWMYILSLLFCGVCLWIRTKECMHLSVHVCIITNYSLCDTDDLVKWRETEFNQWDSAYFRQLQRRRRNVCYRAADDNLNSTGLHWGSTKGHWSHATHAPCMFWMELHGLSFMLALVFQHSFACKQCCRLCYNSTKTFLVTETI